MSVKSSWVIVCLLFSILFIGHTSASQETADQAMIRTGVESFDHGDLTEQIKEDLKIENLPVKVMIGPYYLWGVTGELVKDQPNGYFILIDRYFYNKLTPNEQKALIGHEMGHILYTPIIHVYGLNRTALDISADFFAIKYAGSYAGDDYVGVNAVLSLLDKLYSTPGDRDQPDYKIRKAALEEVKKN